MHSNFKTTFLFTIFGFIPDVIFLKGQVIVAGGPY